MSKPPKYRKHTTREIAFVEYDKKRHYLPGPYNSPQSREAYFQHLERARALDFKAVAVSDKPASMLFLDDLALLYLQFCANAFGVVDARSSYHKYKRAVFRVLDLHGGQLASQFTPLHLKAVQRSMVTEDASRSYINETTAQIKTWFRWCVSECLLDPSVLKSVEAVRGLAPGRTTARESEPRLPARWEDVQPVFQHLPPVPRDMLWMQWHTGARSGSICKAKPEQFDNTGEMMVWHPRHKTEYRGVDLVLPIGPRCLAHIRAYLCDREPDQIMFEPKRAATNGKERGHYTATTYRQALKRGQKRAIAAATEEAQKKGKTVYIPQEWTPHQLRHARGTLVRESYGLEAAQAILGHERIDATQMYAEKRLQLAKQVAKDIG